MFWQVTVANHLAAALGVILFMRFQPLGDFQLDGLGKQLLGAFSEDARQNIPGRTGKETFDPLTSCMVACSCKKFVGKTPFSPSTPPSYLPPYTTFSYSSAKLATSHSAIVIPPPTPESFPPSGEKA